MRHERRKRHHYIPVFLLKHFCESDGMLWYGIRNTQVVKKVPPQHAFVKKELYTSYEEARERADDIAYEPDDRYERKFEELESRAAPAIQKLIAGIRQLVDSGDTDLLGSMSSAEVTACKELLISSMNRTPDAIDSAIIRSRPQSSDALSKLDLQPLRRFPNAVQDTFLQRLERSAAVHVASSSHRDVPGGVNLDESGLAVAAYSSPRRRFILGSCGVAILPDAEDDLDGDWLPISPDQAIGLYDDPANIRLFKDWEGLRCRINKALAERSRFIAGSSRSLVKRTLQRR